MAVDRSEGADRPYPLWEGPGAAPGREQKHQGTHHTSARPPASVVSMRRLLRSVRSATLEKSDDSFRRQGWAEGGERRGKGGQQPVHPCHLGPASLC